MRAQTFAVLIAAFSAAACVSKEPTTSDDGSGGRGTASGGRTGSGGSPSSAAGSGGQSNPTVSGGATGGGGTSGGSGGSAPVAGSGGVPAGSGGAAEGGNGGSGGSDAGTSAADQATAVDTGAAAGGTALMVVGPQINGTDLDTIEVLKAHGLKVETVVDTMAKPMHAEGKALVILSYSLDTDNFKGNDFVDVKAPIIVMEHAVLGNLGMTGTGAADHHWAEPVTALTIVANDSLMAAGLPVGDQTVYSKTGEFFWGVPSAEAIKVATVKGKPNQWVIFGYKEGAMMVGRKAAGKRLQFFFGAHLVDVHYLTDVGKKLLGGAIDWCLKG